MAHERDDFPSVDCVSIRPGFVDTIRLIGILMVLFTAVADASAEPASRPPTRIVFGGGYAYPPYSMLDAEGMPTGFNVELIKAIGREVGMQVEIRMMPWKQLRPALETEHSVDVTTMFYSVERNRIVDFAVPLVTTVHEIFLRRNSPRIDSLTALPP